MVHKLTRIERIPRFFCSHVLRCLLLKYHIYYRENALKCFKALASTHSFSVDYSSTDRQAALSVLPLSCRMAVQSELCPTKGPVTFCIDGLPTFLFVVSD